jgi:hypothetical protein
MEVQWRCSRDAVDGSGGAVEVQWMAVDGSGGAVEVQ